MRDTGVNFCRSTVLSGVALKPVNSKRSSASVPVRWEHLPHDELALEINSAFHIGSTHLTDLEVAQKYLRGETEAAHTARTR